MTQEPTGIPPEVEAAIDAYLAARVDDATWAAYVDSLGLGVALDVATALCLWATDDADAPDWIRDDFVSDPRNWDDPNVPEPPFGLSAIRTLQDFLDVQPSPGSFRITLEKSAHEFFGWNCTYTVTLSERDWESEGVYRAEESLANHAAIQAVWGDADKRHALAVDPWAVAACRAACLSWSPEWARELAARPVAMP